MNPTKRKMLSIMLVLILIGTAIVSFDPQIRSEKFIGRWGSKVEESLISGDPIPDGVGEYRVYDNRIEFPLSARGFGSQTSYYGCYYSFDDVPIAVQDEEAVMTQIAEHVWKWQSEGDNHGQTEKIRDHWYSYEMHF